MFTVKPPLIVRSLLSRYIWNIRNKEKIVYITFDDGPTPEITKWVLEILDMYNAGATFFCIGRNVERNLDIYNEILKRGHSVGNHTYSHINGLKTYNDKYFDDIELASKLIKSNLFRPPYGLIKRSQGRKLVKKYRVIMWDVLTYDFSQKKQPEDCFKNVKRKIRKGSVIVFHDSQKAWKNLETALPLTLEYLQKTGYISKPIILN